MRLIRSSLLPLFVMLFAFNPLWVWAQDISRFTGSFVGAAEFTEAGEIKKRDLSVTFEQTSDGFQLSWTSVTYKPDGRVKAKSYEIEFVPSDRDNIYQSAMKRNLFGKAVPLDPLKGDPFVWARFEENTFSVFSLYIDEIGDYEVQEFHRTLVEGGLDLLFRRFHNGKQEREIEAFLTRE